MLLIVLHFLPFYFIILGKVSFLCEAVVYPLAPLRVLLAFSSIRITPESAFWALFFYRFSALLLKRYNIPNFIIESKEAFVNLYRYKNSVFLIKNGVFSLLFHCYFDLTGF